MMASLNIPIIHRTLDIHTDNPAYCYFCRKERCVNTVAQYQVSSDQCHMSWFDVCCFHYNDIVNLRLYVSQ